MTACGDASVRAHFQNRDLETYVQWSASCDVPSPSCDVPSPPSIVRSIIKIAPQSGYPMQNAQQQKDA